MSPADPRRARRILALQTQLHRSGEWKLGALQSELAENGRTRDAVMATLADDALGPVLVEVAARRLKRLAQARDTLAAAEAAQSARVQDEARRMKQAERRLDAVQRQAAREAEKADLDALLDRIASARDASLPPA
ncbi:hypothetical protein [Aquabacter spiritensis]|uniref:Flagellar FliJ protein n=1 Tax=Aquabacter spiritensis TaxID=933073 RepID=A0A4R3M3V6_9HYPH|nr:hypothetical protein [Aquabacter spiritensis]TCT07954.1 hypothetical protein EDC64_101473 [Aquabacter spiritensis]